MRKIALIASVLMIASMAQAGGKLTSVTPLTLDSISTGSYTAAVDSATSGRVTGFIEGLSIQFSGTARTVDVDVVTVADTGLTGDDARTIFSIDNISAEAFYSIRAGAVDTAGSSLLIGGTNELIRIPLVGDKIQIRAYAAGATGSNIKVIPFIVK